MRREQNTWVTGPTKHGNRWRVIVGNGAARGKKARDVFSYATEEEAAEKRREVERTIRVERLALAETTWREAIEDYCTMLAETCQPLSVEAVKGRLQRYFKPVLDQPTRMERREAQGLYDDLRIRKTAKGTPISVQDHRHCLSRAKALGGWLIEQKIWKVNPIMEVKPVGKPKRGEESKPQHNHDERDAFILKALDLGERGDAGAAAVLCGQICGLRASTIANRKKRHLDKRGTVLWATAKGKTVCLKLAGRTDDEEEIMSRFRKVLAVQAKDKLPDAPLIGKGHDRWWVRRETHRICDLAEVPRVTAHALRGSHISACYEEGESPLAVARSVGHSRESTGQRHYATATSQAAGSMRRVVSGMTIAKEGTVDRG